MPVGAEDSRRTLGELAQSGERLLCKQEVTGSSPVFSTVGRATDGVAPSASAESRVASSSRDPTRSRLAGGA